MLLLLLLLVVVLLLVCSLPCTGTTVSWLVSGWANTVDSVEWMSETYIE